jgi:putative endonuclease
VTVGRRRLGEAAEALAAERLGAAGLRVIERNARVRDPETGLAGELDLIAGCPGAIVFVEVKAARAGRRAGPERPALAVGRRKQLQIRRLARAWLAMRSDLPRFASIRFDVVGVTYQPGESADVEWIRGAF